MVTLKDIENMLKDLTKTELKKLIKRVDKELSGHPSDLKALLTAKRYANNHCHCTLYGGIYMRYKKALLILALVTCLTACEKSSTSNDMDGAHYWDADGNPITFSGIVGKGYETTLAEVSETDIADNTDTMVSEGFFLPCTNGSYLMIVDNQGPTEMFPENGDNSIYDDLSAGDTIMVTHSGIEETYPGQTTIYSIEKISDGDLSDIPADTLTKLEEIGWIAVTNSQSVE